MFSKRFSDIFLHIHRHVSKNTKNSALLVFNKSNKLKLNRASYLIQPKSAVLNKNTTTRLVNPMTFWPQLLLNGIKIVHQPGNSELYSTRRFERGEIIIDFNYNSNIKKYPTQTSVEIGKDKHAIHPYGSYLNHVVNPNCYVENGKLVAKKTINPNNPIRFNYQQNESKMKAPFFSKDNGEYVAGRDKLELTRSDLIIIKCSLQHALENMPNGQQFIPDFSYYEYTEDKVKAEIITMCADMGIKQVKVPHLHDADVEILKAAKEKRVKLDFGLHYLHHDVDTRDFIPGM